MTRKPHTDLERWLAAEAAGDDFAAEEAFGALFQALPRLAPRHGFSERVVFRELFLSGLTLLDLREADPQAMSMSNIAARQEVRDLVRALDLPAVSVAACLCLQTRMTRLSTPFLPRSGGTPPLGRTQSSASTASFVQFTKVA